MDELLRLRQENKALKEKIKSLADKLESAASLETEAAIAHAIEHSLGGVALADRRWRVRYANTAIIRLWGYDSIDEVLGRPSFDFFIGVEPEKADRIVRTIQRKGLWQGELTGKKKDGTVFYAFMAGSRLVDRSGEFSGSVISCIDMTDYKEAMSALTESEERYKATLDHLGDSVYLVDRDMVIVYVNERLHQYAKLFGVDFRGGVGKRLTEIVGKFDYNYEAEFRQVIETGKPIIAEGEITVGDRVFQAEKRRIPIVNKGVVTHVVTVLHDITQRKLSEEKLKQSEEKYRAIADSVPVGIFIHVEGNIKYAGNEGARMLGYEPEELIGKNITDLVHENDRELVIDRARRRAMGEDVPGGYEATILRKDGTTTPALIYGSNIDYLGEKAIQGVLIDISKRKKVERDLEETLERLRQSEERYRLLVETGNDGIMVISDEKTVFINRMVMKMIGRTEAELMNRSPWEIIHPDDRDLVVKNYFERIGGRNPPDRYEFRVVAKDGSVVTVELNVVRTDWEGKKAVLCFLRDITDRKTAEQEQARLQNQLLSAQKMEAIGTLAGGMAHNFNNILVGIMGYSEYLLLKKDESDPDYKAIRTIHEGSVKASDLTRQLLNIARGGEFKRVRISLNDVIGRVLPLIAGTFNKSIEVSTILDPKPLIMEGDIGQLEQSLLNICINARDAMPDGGSLVIKTENKQLDEHFVKAHLGSRAGWHVVLSVTDSGVGMPPQVKDHIFEPFFTTKKHAGGSGMGLATVWGIVKNHQGIVSVYSEPGRGTTFRLYFPAISDIEETEGNSDGEIQPGRGETILLVDDEPIIREMWGDILEEVGYRVLTAEGGREALDLLEERGGEVDLVILDMIMPQMGGEESFRRIHERYPGLTVLLSSGYTENGEVRKVIDAGAAGFIQKPYQIRQLTMKIREVLEGKG